MALLILDASSCSVLLLCRLRDPTTKTAAVDWLFTPCVVDSVKFCIVKDDASRRANPTSNTCMATAGIDGPRSDENDAPLLLTVMTAFVT